MNEPVVVEEVAGTDVSGVTLTPEAAKRLNVKTADVENLAGSTVIPYAAIFYSPTGEAWTYTNPGGLTFVRQLIVVDSIDGARARITVGPEPGTKVATVGVAELYGAESGLGVDSSH